MSRPTPVGIQRDGIDIRISWDDGNCLKYRPSAIRKACPCAVCREKNKAVEQSIGGGLHLPVLSKAETQPLEVVKMEPVGNYAYNIHFSDGHHSGIFSFDLLYSLGSKI